MSTDVEAMISEQAIESLARMRREFEEFFIACETPDGEPTTPDEEAFNRAVTFLYPTNRRRDDAPRR